ncbi:MAG TPA: hydantoinase B/oxoprolinase family protein, partial [Polyangiaceae bacterium]
MSRWQFWIDRGGTFTDIVAKLPNGELVTHKLLSDAPERYADAAVADIRQLLEAAGAIERGGVLSSAVIERVRMGTTVATNALLERKGEPTALAITRGFRDALRIAYQNRPRLFDRNILLPELLYSRVVEIDERVSARGEVLRPLDEAAARRALESVIADGISAIAIVLMHGYRYWEHERTLVRLAESSGFRQISVSHAVSPLIKLVARGDTTVVDAYLSPILRRYVEGIARELPGVELEFMQSNGGLTAARHFQGKDSILSGPAGGIVGMARASRHAGFDRVIGFDMGGTSTDVSHFAGDPADLERSFESVVAGVRVRAPMLSIHTVAAGGGSIVRFDGTRYRVGPESAGANPGPACYRRGGPLTVTDCNVVLGKIQPRYFPAFFGPEGNQPLDDETPRARLAALAGEIADATGDRRAPEEVAEGFLEIAVGNMANAIKRVSVARGHDVTHYTLCVFGGAGAQHACRVADELGMKRIFSHPLAGVLSAYGMGLADRTAHRERSIERRLDAAAAVETDEALSALAESAWEELRGQGIEEEHIHVVKRAHLRYEGTDTALPVALSDAERMRNDFERAYLERFAFTMPGKPLVVEAVSVEAIGRGDSLKSSSAAHATTSGPAVPVEQVRMFSEGRWHDTPLYRRETLSAGCSIRGPAIIAEANQTVVVEPGWHAERTKDGALVLDRVEARSRPDAGGTRADPVRLEVFNNLFMSIAEQMGSTLQSTAYSVNIKERLDFSCAVFDEAGNLVANAPHMPVHLGSMGESVQTVIRRGSVHPGDVYVLNAPYAGGTHLPDITVVTPVFGEPSPQPLFYVASRGHHADVGGKTPGSMPSDSVSVEEEGVLIDRFLLVERGRYREAEARALFSSGAHPARNVEQNLADLRAQVAANETGVRELTKMVRHWGLEVVSAYMAHVQKNAEEAVRRVLGALDDGSYEYRLDPTTTPDGPVEPVIRVSIRVDRSNRSATVDFAGTSPQLANNFNAPRSITTAAVLYVFRTLVGEEIPLNAGCLVPLHILVPEGSLLNPRYPAAVVAGNVETSQCVTQALYGALQVMAESAGTMNNFTFGNARYQYYETVSSGSSAGIVRGPDGVVIGGFEGTDVVQTHMTNSRLTDPEVLEWRFPV